MTKRIPALALMMLLTSSGVLTAQTNSKISASDAAVTETNNTPSCKDDHGEDRQANSTGAKSTDGTKRDKKKIKHDAKPAQSKEEQEFERMLMGMFG